MGETYLKQAITKPVSKDGKGPLVLFGASTVQGWRNTQEDAHICQPQLDGTASLWGVFDGHNGAEVAQFAAKRLPKILLSNKNYREGKYELALQESFQAMDDLLLARDSIKELISLRQAYSKAPITRQNAPAIASGCTAVVALVKNGTAYVANLGDSRCILARNGKAYPLSEDHKPDSDTEKARIEAAGGEVVSGRINYGVNVSRALGDHLYKRNPNIGKKEQMIIAWPDVKTEKLNPKTDPFMVLICDGIWNCVPNHDLIAYVNKRITKVRPLSKICEQIFNQIIPKVMPKRGIIGKDNMTILIVKFEGGAEAQGAKAVKKIRSKESVFIPNHTSSIKKPGAPPGAYSPSGGAPPASEPPAPQ